MTTTEERKKNLAKYEKALRKFGIDPTMLLEKYGRQLENSTFTAKNMNNYDYDGSLLEIVINVLTPYAMKLNELLPEDCRVPKDSLAKVCLLHHIAKCIRIIPNDVPWEIEKRGIKYKYDPDQPSIKTGFHSLLMCQECGITFTTEEGEAMIVNDRDPLDDQARWHSSTFATIVKMANELTYVQLLNTTVE